MPTTTFTLADEERELLPSDDDVNGYAKHGWYLSKKLLTDDEVDTLLAASEQFYAGERDRRLLHWPPTLSYWEPSHGAVQRHDFGRPRTLSRHAAEGRVAASPQVGQHPGHGPHGGRMIGRTGQRAA